MTDTGAFGAVCDTVFESKGTVSSDVLQSFASNQVTIGSGDVDSGILGSYKPEGTFNGVGDIYSQCHKGTDVTVALEATGNVITAALGEYNTPSYPVGAGDVNSSILGEYGTDIALNGEGDVSSKILTEVMVKIPLEGVGDMPAAWIMGATGYMLGLYGQDAKACIFDNFVFDRFIEVDGNVYASAPDGIYLLGAANDDGTAIVASAKINLRKLGRNVVKRLRAVYADGTYKLNVDIDGTDRDYTSSSNGKVQCGHKHYGKEVTLTYSEFESLYATEIFYYNLPRRR